MNSHQSKLAEKSNRPYLVKDKRDKEDLAVILTNSGFRIHYNDCIRHRGNYQGCFRENNLHIVPGSELDRFIINYESKASENTAKQSAEERFNRLFSS